MKKRFSQLKYLATAALLLAVLASPVLASSGEFNLSSRDSVAFLISDIYQNGQELGVVTGTGFFVGESGKDPQYLVTNEHVIDDFLRSGGGTGESSLYVVYDQSDTVEAYVVAYDLDKDLAILKVADPTDKRVPARLQSTSDSLIGSTAFAIGYPTVADETIHSISRFDKSDATVTGGRINRIITESGTGRVLLQMDVSIRGGNSGGPLVNAKGNVLGINTLTSKLADNLSYAVSADELIPLLKNNNIPYMLASPGPSPALILGGAAVAAVVIIAVAVLAVVTSKKKKAAPVPAAADEAAGSAPAPQPSAAPVRQPTLHSTSAQHSGLKVPLGGQPTLIGRDPAVCRVVFREGTAGVSSRHCQVSYDAAQGIFILTDLKSTYGTFLANRQQLMPGIPYTLKPRDSFYLGEPDNALYVDLE